MVLARKSQCLVCSNPTNCVFSKVSGLGLCGTYTMKGTEHTNKSTNDENKMLSKGLSSLEDEICLDEMDQEKKKPKKVISTKDRHTFFNFFNMKEKERKEVEENLKSKEEEKNKRVAKEKLKDVFKLIW